jgi:transcriptional regulator with XRE-family HTH domain
MHDGEKIKLLRVMKDYSQEGIAKSLGITQQAYSQIEQKQIIEEARLKKILSLIKSSPEELKKMDILFHGSK